MEYDGNDVDVVFEVFIVCEFGEVVIVLGCFCLNGLLV